MKNFLTLISWCLFVFELSGQDVISSIPGSVKKEDFNPEKYNADQQAADMVYFDKGFNALTVTSVEYNNSHTPAITIRKKTELRQETLADDISEILGTAAGDFISFDSTMSFDQPSFIRAYAGEERGDSLVHILPFHYGLLNECPFKEKERNFPVEFACLPVCQRVTFVEISPNFGLDSLPENIIFQSEADKSLVFEIQSRQQQDYSPFKNNIQPGTF